MQAILAGLRAAGESTRLRLLHILSRGEFNVSELTRILRQSQPRVSRHLKLMAEAGLIERYKEGSWVMVRLNGQGPGGELAAMIAELLQRGNGDFAGDDKRIDQVLEERRQAAAAYFAAVASDWDRVRSLYVDEGEVEAAIVKLVGDRPLGQLVDLGTGTGRMLELLGKRATQAVGIDASREMLALARANLERAGIANAQARHGDIYALPQADASVDVVIIHQVLHYLDDVAGALGEAGRITRPGGRIVIVDFAPHGLEFLREEHAHRRLGIDAVDMAGWLKAAGFKVREHRKLAPGKNDGDGLTVSLWLGERTARP